MIIQDILPNILFAVPYSAGQHTCAIIRAEGALSGKVGLSTCNLGICKPLQIIGSYINERTSPGLFDHQDPRAAGYPCGVPVTLATELTHHLELLM